LAAFRLLFALLCSVALPPVLGTRASGLLFLGCITSAMVVFAVARGKPNPRDPQEQIQDTVLPMMLGMSAARIEEAGTSYLVAISFSCVVAYGLKAFRITSPRRRGQQRSGPGSS
jgi:hypothetical protein